MLVIGLTGGIATGKSTASREFQAQGVPVIDADKIARQVLEPGETSYTLVVKNFGSTVLDSSQRIDRAKLAAQIFKDGEKRQLLNSCTHPYIRRKILLELLSLYVRGHAICVLDVPLLFESGLDRVCARTLVVSCEGGQQIARLCQRDALSEEAAKARVAAQMPMAEKERRATRVLDNYGSQEVLCEQVRDVVQKWRPGMLRTWAALAAPVGAAAGLVFVRSPWGLGALCTCSLWMLSSLL
ncbi:Dephospho-CoA kinase [Coemansia sp. RSA 2705]|nr:Dephospho-CoA kinase [Coemansia sp. RSA 2705]